MQGAVMDFNNVLFFPRSGKVLENEISPEEFQEMSAEERQKYVEENYDATVDFERVIDIICSVYKQTNDQKYDYVLEWRASSPVGERGTGNLISRVVFNEFDESFVNKIVCNFVGQMEAEDELVFYTQKIDCKESNLKLRKKLLAESLVGMFEMLDSNNLGKEVCKERALEAVDQISPRRIKKEDLSVILKEVAQEYGLKVSYLLENEERGKKRVTKIPIPSFD